MYAAYVSKKSSTCITGHAGRKRLRVCCLCVEEEQYMHNRPRRQKEVTCVCCLCVEEEQYMHNRPRRQKEVTCVCCLCVEKSSTCITGHAGRKRLHVCCLSVEEEQ